MKNIFAILSFLTISSFDYAQIQNVTILTEPKVILSENGRLVFNICIDKQPITFNEDLDYFWYNDFSKIKSTKGGAGGSLLHGKYQFFDENGNLLYESNFYLGLKDGVSKAWNADGEIKEIYTYKRGKLIYSKLKSENGDKYIEWNGPALEKGSIKKIYTSYGSLEETEEMLDSLKFKVTDFYFDGKIQKKYTTDIVGWMYDEYIEYYRNGNMKIYGKFEENWRIGEWKWFKEDGSVEAVEKYRIEKLFNPDNKILEKGGEYFDSNKNVWEKNGLWIWYKDNGKDWDKTKMYKYGVEVENKK